MDKLREKRLQCEAKCLVQTGKMPSLKSRFVWPIILGIQDDGLVVSRG